jgi:hypothetical protein
MIKLAADVRPGDRVLVLDRFAAVVEVTATGSKKFGTDDIPMLRFALGPEARPARSIELAADQNIEVQP